MIKYFYSILCALIAYSSIAQPKIENALLWKIEDPAQKVAPSYLFGTIHLIGKKDFVLKEEVTNALNQCKNIVFEVNMEDMTDMSKMMNLMMQANMAGDTTLQDLLSQQDYAMVSNYFEKEGIPLVMFERMKPMFITTMVMGTMSGGDSKEEMMSYEMELMNYAKDKKLKMDGLESFEYQMGIFDIIPYKVQAKMLVDGIQSGKDTTQVNQLQQLVDLYKKQDLSKLQELMQADTEGLGVYTKLLLDDRNTNWVPKIKAKIKESTFFAVGAGHLAGKTGVITLLREAGLKVTPIQQL